MTETTDTTTEVTTTEVRPADAVRAEIDDLRAQIAEVQNSNAVAVAQADDAIRTARLVRERDRLREELASLQAQAEAHGAVRVTNTEVVDPETGVRLDAALVGSGVQEGVTATSVILQTGETAVVETGADGEPVVTPGETSAVTPTITVPVTPTIPPTTPPVVPGVTPSVGNGGGTDPAVVTTETTDTPRRPR